MCIRDRFTDDLLTVVNITELAHEGPHEPEHEQHIQDHAQQRIDVYKRQIELRQPQLITFCNLTVVFIFSRCLFSGSRLALLQLGPPYLEHTQQQATEHRAPKRRNHRRRGNRTASAAAAYEPPVKVPPDHTRRYADQRQQVPLHESFDFT